MMRRFISFAITLMGLVVVAPAAAQYYGSELSPADRARLDALQRSQAEADAKHAAEMKALRKELLRLPPLPAERNVLLGNWRLEGRGSRAHCLSAGCEGARAVPVLEPGSAS